MGESFVAMSALVSSLFCVCNNILFPVLAFHHTGVKEVGLPRKIAHAAIVLYGCVIMVLGTVSAIQALTPHVQQEPGTSMREGITEGCRSDYQCSAQNDCGR